MPLDMLVMRNRFELALDEADVLEQVQVACDRMLDRSGLRRY